MTHSINSLQSQIWKTILIVFAVLVISYGIFRIIPIIRGVNITTAEATESEVQSNSLTLHGAAEHARSLSINGRPILIDPSGTFSDEIMLTNGINRITLVAEDIRGHIHTKEIVITGSPLKESREVAQISTETSTH